MPSIRGLAISLILCSFPAALRADDGTDVVRAYMAAYSANFLKVVALSTIVGFPTFVLVGIGAILFPYRRKPAYEASVSNISFLGLPLLVYFGIGSILAGLFGAWLWFAYPTLGLPRAGDGIAAQLLTSPFRGGLALVVFDLVLGAIIYYAGKA